MWALRWCRIDGSTTNLLGLLLGSLVEAAQRVLETGGQSLERLGVGLPRRHLEFALWAKLECGVEVDECDK